MALSLHLLGPPPCMIDAPDGFYGANAPILELIITTDDVMLANCDVRSDKITMALNRCHAMYQSIELAILVRHDNYTMVA